MNRGEPNYFRIITSSQLQHLQARQLLRVTFRGGRGDEYEDAACISKDIVRKDLIKASNAMIPIADVISTLKDIPPLSLSMYNLEG